MSLISAKEMRGLFVAAATAMLSACASTGDRPLSEPMAPDSAISTKAVQDQAKQKSDAEIKKMTAEADMQLADTKKKVAVEAKKKAEAELKQKAEEEVLAKQKAEEAAVAAKKAAEEEEAKKKELEKNPPMMCTEHSAVLLPAKNKKGEILVTPEGKELYEGFQFCLKMKDGSLVTRHAVFKELVSEDAFAEGDAETFAVGPSLFEAKELLDKTRQAEATAENPKQAAAEGQAPVVQAEARAPQVPVSYTDENKGETPSVPVPKLNTMGGAMPFTQ